MKYESKNYIINLMALRANAFVRDGVLCDKQLITESSITKKYKMKHAWINLKMEIRKACKMMLGVI